MAWHLWVISFLYTDIIVKWEEEEMVNNCLESKAGAKFRGSYMSKLLGNEQG
jgi:hypothetical protein